MFLFADELSEFYLSDKSNPVNLKDTINQNTTHQGRITLLFVISILLLVVFFSLDVLIGSVRIPLSGALDLLSGKAVTNPVWSTIILDFRIPKAITAILAGAALSVSGLQMQTIFRNPLAGPYVLGISSGASLGVAILIMGFLPLLHLNNINYMGSWAQIVAAWLGSGMVLFLILAVSARVRDIMTILILGILFGSATSAFVSMLQYFTNQSMLKLFVIWSLGSLGNLTRMQLNILIPSVAVGLLLAFFLSKVLNALLLGETYAKSMGVNIRLVRITVFISTSILAGSITAFCGPIGFIGIAVPHISRFLFRSADHRVLLPGSMLLGAVVMLLSDLLSQLPGQDTQLPINSVTALLGIPVVVWIVIKNQQMSDFS